jgi:L-asparaginase/Glu-tRNA(Gln) amidotransferase subunit D
MHLHMQAQVFKRVMQHLKAKHGCLVNHNVDSLKEK